MSVGPEHDPEFRDIWPKPAPAQGVRLAELLAGVALLALLVGVLLPAPGSCPPATPRIRCANNLRQVALAVRSYAHKYNSLPPAYTVDAAGRPLHSWRTLILPDMDEQALYDSIDLTKSWDDPANARALAATPSIYRCPELAGPPTATTYLAIAAPGGCMAPGAPRRLADVTDAHGSTLLLIEAADNAAVPWMAPRDAQVPSLQMLGKARELPHDGGVNACCVDGSARFLDGDTTPAALRALITIEGGDDEAAKSAFR